MKYFLISFGLIFCSIIFVGSVQAVDQSNLRESECLTIEATMQASGNWPGGDLNLSCEGVANGTRYTAEDGSVIDSLGWCPGDEKTISPGGSTTLKGCNCNLGKPGKCLKIGNLPKGCTVTSGEYCGQNRSSINAAIAVSCKPEEKPTTPPRARGCECKFRESCTTDSGDVGERECNGVNKNNACEFDGDACPADCSECRAKNKPPKEKPPEENKPPGEKPPEENPPGEKTTPTPTGQPQNSPTPNAKVTPKPSPSPSFSPAMCKCDGIESSLIFPGQSTSVSAFAKVEGKDLSGAEVKDMTFYLAKDSTVIAKSDPIGASIIDKTNSKIRYKSDWQFTLPNNVDKNAIYRVWTQQRCVKKQSVLGVNTTNDQTNNKDFISNIKSFFGNLFSSTSQYPSVQAPSQPGSNAAAPSADTSNTVNNEKLQLQPLYPATVVPQTKDQSCRFLMFKFEK